MNRTYTTLTGEALEMMIDTLFDDAHARRKEDLVTQAVLVLADGDSHKSVQEAVRAKGIEIFQIYIGRSICIGELDQIANQPSDSNRLNFISFHLNQINFVIATETKKGMIFNIVKNIAKKRLRNVKLAYPNRCAL